MDSFTINVAKVIRDFKRTTSGLQKQIPYAIATALQNTAQLVKNAELENFKSKFDMPTPFTMNSIGITGSIASLKKNPTITIFVKDIQAAYLDPYEVGGKSIPAKPGDVAMLVPKNIKLNQYGNIPYQAIKKLLAQEAPTSYNAKGKMRGTGKASSKFFFGTINTKSGPVSGLWQRTAIAKTKAVAVKFNSKKKSFQSMGQLRGIKLIVRFDDPRPISPMLGYQERAKEIVDKNFLPELKRGMEKAMKTAR